MNRRAECVGFDLDHPAEFVLEASRGCGDEAATASWGFAYILAVSLQAVCRMMRQAARPDRPSRPSRLGQARPRDIVPPPGDIVDTEPDSGWTEGSFSVNHNGAAEYHLPLWVPDGRGGLTPELALHYNSQAGNGLVGVGWSLSAGLSSISAVPALAGARWSSREFRLSAERTPPTASTASGCDRSRVVATASRTTARSETPSLASAPITPRAAQPTGWHFVVWTKDGRILTDDILLRAYQLTGQNPEFPSFSRSAARVTVSWALRTIEDRNGNAITIQYETLERQDNQWSVEMVPKFITYGPDRSIEFVYDEGRKAG